MKPLFIPCCLLVFVVCEPQFPYEDEETEARNELGLFRNLEEVLNAFRRDHSSISKQILDAYETKCMYTEEPTLPDEKRKPFIVIEGNHRPSKESIGSKLAGLMGGRYIAQIAPCLRKFSYKLKSTHPLRRALQFLSLYASAFEARVQMSLGRPVVVNSYWTEQLSFSVTRSFQAGALPPVEANIFRYPDDLMAPDIHVFLDFGEALYTTTPATSFRFYDISNVRKTTDIKKRKLQVYRHLQSRLPILIHQLQRVSNRVTSDQLLGQIKANLSGIRDFDLTPTTFDY